MRRLVAATAAAPRTCAPHRVRAPEASVKVTPVVTRSSTTTTRESRTRCIADRRTINAPARFAARACDDKPAESATNRRCVSTGATATCHPATRNRRTARVASIRTVSSPRRRTAARADGAGTTRAGSPGSRHDPIARARASPSGRASPTAPRSLKAISSARVASSYVATTHVGGSPGGQGVGRCRTGAAARAIAQRAQTGPSGTPQPAQRAGQIRSSSDDMPHSVNRQGRRDSRARRRVWIGSVIPRRIPD